MFFPLIDIRVSHCLNLNCSQWSLGYCSLGRVWLVGQLKHAIYAKANHLGMMIILCLIIIGNIMLTSASNVVWLLAW